MNYCMHAFKPFAPAAQGFFLIVLVQWFSFPSGSLAQERGPDPGTYLDSLLNIKINTAAKHWQTSTEAPASITIITSSDIEQYGYRTLDEALARVRGLYTTYDRNYTYIGIRGFSRPTDYNNRILLLLNGHVLNENFYGSALLGSETAIALNSIDRIEVVRGPGSVLYGSGAMFSVINIITKTGRALDGAHAAAEIGSFGRRAGSVSYGRKLENDLDLAFSFSAERTDGQDLFFPEFADDNEARGFARNMDWEQSLGTLASLSWNTLSLEGFYSDREKGIPTASYGTIFGDPRGQTSDRRGFITLKYDKELSPSRGIMARGYYNWYHYSGTYPYESLLQDATAGRWFGGEVQYRWDPSASRRLIFGAEAGHNFRADYRSHEGGITYFDDNFPFSLYSLFTQGEFQISEELLLTIGLRLDHHSTIQTSFVPRASLVYTTDGAGTIKLLFGDAFRNPNMYELNYEDFQSGFLSNRGLRSEHIRTFELVWEKRFGEFFHSAASLYHYRMKDLIDQVLDPANLMLQHRNIADVVASGGEWELGFRFNPSLHGYVNMGYQRAEAGTSGVELTNSPSHLVRAGLAHPLTPYASLAYEWQYQSRRATVMGSFTPPFSTFDAILRVHPFKSESDVSTSLMERVEVAFLVKNLFGRTYSMPAGFEHRQVSFQQDGRTYALRVEVGL